MKDSIRKPLFRRVVSAVLAVGLFISASAADVPIVSKVTAANKQNYTVDNIFGSYRQSITSGDGFGYVAFEELSVSGHQHVNIAARTVTNGQTESEFCLRRSHGYPPTVNYIKRFDPLNGTVKVGEIKDTLVVGDEYTTRTNGSERFIIDSSNYEHKVEIAGTVMNYSSWDKGLDFPKLQNDFCNYSDQLKNMTASVDLKNLGSNNKITNGDISVDFSDGNKKYIDIDSSADKIFVVNATSDIITGGMDEYRVRFKKTNTDAIVVINIDMKNKTSIYFEKGVLPMFTSDNGGTFYTPPAQEQVWETDHNRIYLNFYSSTTANGQYTGTVGFSEHSIATVIAPMAEVNSYGNYEGAAAARKITANGQSHRCAPYKVIPFNGSTTEYIKATANPIKLIKTFTEDGIETSVSGDVLNSTGFTLYEVSGATEAVVSGNENITPKLDNNRYIVTFDSNIEVGKLYKIKETKSDSKFVSVTPEWYAMVDDDGDVKYSKTKDGIFISDLPVFVNERTPKINATFSFYKKFVTGTTVDNVTDESELKNTVFSISLNGSSTPIDTFTLYDTKNSFDSTNGFPINYNRNDIAVDKVYVIEEISTGVYSPDDHDAKIYVKYDSSKQKTLYSSTENGVFTEANNSNVNVRTFTNKKSDTHAVANDIVLYKTYTANGYDINSNVQELCDNTVFTLYKTDGTVVAAKKPEYKVDKYVVTFTSADGLDINARYKITETSKAGFNDGTTVNGVETDTWYARIDSSGNVTYSANPDRGFRSSAPTFANEKNVPIKLNKTFKRNGTATSVSTSELKKVTFEIFKSDGSGNAAGTAISAAKTERKYNGSNYTYTFYFDDSHKLESNQRYVIKETGHGDYLPDVSEVYVSVTETGDVKYSDSYNGTYNNTVPEFTNSYDEINVTVTKIFKDKNGNIVNDKEISNDILNDTFITIKGSDGRTVSKNVERISSGNYQVTFSNADGITDGRYTITETAASEGYTKDVTEIIAVVENGNVTYTNSENNTIRPEFVNVKTSEEIPDNPDDDNPVTATVKISKKAVGGSDELPGANMKLSVSGNVDFSKVTAENGKDISIDTTAKTVTWTSGSTPCVIKNLPEGSYTLEETAAPSGYVTLTTTITFTIDGSGNIKNFKPGTTEATAAVLDKTEKLITVYNNAESSGDDPSDDDPSDDNPSDDDPSGDNPSDDDPSDDNPSGGDSSDDNPSGGDSSDDNPSGGDSSDDNPSGDEPANPVKPIIDITVTYKNNGVV